MADQAQAPKKEAPEWQQAYQAEYTRTTGKQAKFVPKAGGWFELVLEGADISRRMPVRRPQVDAMTERLRNRASKDA